MTSDVDKFFDNRVMREIEGHVRQAMMAKRVRERRVKETKWRIDNVQQTV